MIQVLQFREKNGFNLALKGSNNGVKEGNIAHKKKSVFQYKIKDKFMV